MDGHPVYQIELYWWWKILVFIRETDRHALDEDPALEAVDLGLDGARLAVLQLEGVD